MSVTEKSMKPEKCPDICRSPADDAVSPVVGVMLMIVITVVIAAVVGISASGVLDSSSAHTETPVVEFLGIYTGGFTQASWNAYVREYTKADYDGKPAGLLFRVNGNMPLDLTKLRIDLTANMPYIAQTRAGGHSSFTYDDAVFLQNLPQSAGGSIIPGSYITPPAYMKNHRVLIPGADLDDPDFAEKAFAETAVPGTMFLFVPEAVNFGSNIVVPLVGSDETSPLTQMPVDGNTLMTLTDTDSGTVYVSHCLDADDYIITMH